MYVRPCERMTVLNIIFGRSSAHSLTVIISYVKGSARECSLCHVMHDAIITIIIAHNNMTIKPPRFPPSTTNRLTEIPFLFFPFSQSGIIKVSEWLGFT